MVVVMGVTYTPPVKVVVTPTPTPKPPTKEELLKLVNEERAKVGAAALTVDPKLEQSAQWKADKMAETGVYNHTDETTGKNDGLDYLDSLKPTCSNISENLHWGTDYYGTSGGTIAGWVGSKPHYAAMVDSGYTSTGFGIATARDGTFIAVEHFCKP